MLAVEVEYWLMPEESQALLPVRVELILKERLRELLLRSNRKG